MESPANVVEKEKIWSNLPQTIPAAVIFSAGLYLLSIHNYLLYHAMVELFAAVVAFTILGEAYYLGCSKMIQTRHLLTIVLVLTSGLF